MTPPTTTATATAEAPAPSELRPPALRALKAVPGATPTTTRMPPAGLRALDVQRLIDRVAIRVAPAAAGALIALSHLPHPGPAILLFASMLGAAHVIERRSLPLHLLPGSRVLLALASPLIGALVAAGVIAAAGGSMPLASLQAPVIGAWLVMALGAWIKVRVEEHARVRIAVIGPAAFAADLATELEAAGIRSREVVGWIGPAGDADGLARLGKLADVREAVLERDIELLVCDPEWEGMRGSEGSGPSVLEWVADSCFDLPVRMIGANQLYEELFGHVPLGTTGAAWFQYIMHPNFRTTSPRSKRVFDLVFGVVLGLITLPILAAAAVAIKLGDRGPVLYRQRRLGEHGEAFEIIKLRTMRPDAEELTGPQWSEAGDERVTRVGRLLRRTHVDELPQLWNVLRGEMTLVGPRPERPEIVAELEQQFARYSRRHLVKPGATGWAALRCGYAGSAQGSAWKLCHDLFYVKHRSILGDLLILFETAFEVGRDTHRALRTPAERFILEGETRG